MKSQRSFSPTRLLCLVALGLQLLAVPTASSAGFVNTGSLTTNRCYHTATLLPNGKVLVAGGLNSPNNHASFLSNTELYDSAIGTWAVTGALSSVRHSHTATLLPNGKVLVVGGSNNTNWLSSAELYDPNTGAWTATGAMSTARYAHTATLLPNGKVLVAGGYNSTLRTLLSAELYDPVTGTWAATGTLSAARRDHTATLLPNGNVLVSGGHYSTINNTNITLLSAELYDPVTGTWMSTGTLSAARYAHSATTLPNGKVLVAGGRYSTTITNFTLFSAEVYDPATGTWTATGALNAARNLHTATLLPNGKVLVAGGLNGASALSNTESYDMVTGTWTAIDAINTARYSHAVTLLPNGKVLLAGGALQQRFSFQRGGV
jgi:N-acetylneuraminic acid mutarotase